MNKKLLTLSLVALMLPTLAGCGSEKKAASRMELSINPDIEILLDEDGFVVSVTALNNDGAVVISGEKLVGKTAEEASKTIVDISYKCGYLNETNNNVRVSISSDSVSSLFSNVESKINSYLQDNEIVANVKQEVSDFATNLDAKIAELSCKYESSEVASMTLEEKLSILNDYRKETKDLISEELQNSYAVQKANEYQEELLNAKKEAISKLDATVASAYQNLIKGVQTTIDTINKLYEDNFVDSDSLYQKTLAKVYSYKSLITKMNKCTTINGLIEAIEKSSLNEDVVFSAVKATLTASKLTLGDVDFTQENLLSKGAKTVVSGALTAVSTGLDGVIEGLKTLKSTAQGLIDQANVTLNNALQEIKDYELQMPSTIISDLEAKADEFVKKAQEEVKNEYNAFASEHKADIEAAKKQYANIKADLMA